MKNIPRYIVRLQCDFGHRIARATRLFIVVAVSLQLVPSVAKSRASIVCRPNVRPVINLCKAGRRKASRFYAHGMDRSFDWLLKYQAYDFGLLAEVVLLVAPPSPAPSAATCY